VLPIDKPLDPAQLVIGWHQLVHTNHLDLPRLLTAPDRERRKSHTSQPRDQTGRNFNRLLEPQPRANGRRDYWRPLADDDKPWPLRGLPQGTQVILHDTTPGEDTTQTPKSVSEARAHWITRYLNGRFLRLPEQVEVLVREDHNDKADWRDPGPLRRIHGQQHHLEQRALRRSRSQRSREDCRMPHAR
jgi:hypothetical protein